MFLPFSCIDLHNVLFFLLLTQSKIVLAGSTFSSHSKSSASAESSAKQLEASQQIEYAQPQLLSSSQIRRRKRDGGIAPLGLAVVSGIIGMTTHAVQELTSFQPMASNGGCKWFGNAPFCNHHCPPEYDLIRKENGRCSNFWLSGFCVPDESFGEPCSTLFGGFFKKRFCCKSDPTECSWSGRWMDAVGNHNVYCRYDNSVGKCGELSCAINHFERKMKSRSPISGEHCDQLQLFNATGHATCGYIAWYSSGPEGSEEVVSSWYKTGG